MISESSDFTTAFIGTPDAITHNYRIASSFKLFNNLKPNKTYYIKIRSEKTTGFDNSAYSSVVSATTLKRKTIPPTGLTANNETKNSVYLSWNLISSLGTTIYNYNNQNSYYPHGYEAQYSTSLSFSNASIVPLVTSHPLSPAVTLSGLVSNQEYYIRIRSKAGGDFETSDWSNSVQFQTLVDPLANVQPGYASGGSYGTITLDYESTNFVSFQVGWSAGTHISIQWGDGQIEHKILSKNSTITHDYSSVGDKTVIITGVIANSIKFYTNHWDRDLQSKADVARTKLRHAKLEGFALQNCSSMFSGCSGLRTVDLTNFNSHTVLGSYSNMFRECTALTTINGLTSLLQRGVSGDSISTASMFYSCRSLQSVNVSGWQLRTTSYWGTSLSGMFSECHNLHTITGLSTWNTVDVRYLPYMFKNCYRISDLTGLNNWNVQKVESVQYMFYRAGMLTSLSANLSSWQLALNLMSARDKVFFAEGIGGNQFTGPTLY